MVCCQLLQPCHKQLAPLHMPGDQHIPEEHYKIFMFYICMYIHVCAYEICFTFTRTSISVLADNVELIEWFFRGFQHFSHHFSPPSFLRKERSKSIPMSHWSFLGVNVLKPFPYLPDLALAFGCCSHGVNFKTREELIDRVKEQLKLMPK